MRLVDFGLITIISDLPNVPPSSVGNGGAARFMSPELINPEGFGLEKSRHTKPSDCYALGMVTYQTISGELPFQEFLDQTVTLKVTNGRRPSRGTKFADHLWKIVEWCWTHKPEDRPTIEEILQYFETSSESLPPRHNGGMEGGGGPPANHNGVTSTLGRD